MTDFIIRTPRPEEANAMAEIEALGFAPAEAASLAQITARLAVFPEQFFVAEQDNRVVGFINGCSADTPHLPDKFYADANHHQPNGAYAFVFGLAVHPDYQRRGMAAALLNHYIATMRERGKRGVVLTCKAHLLDYYRGFGFVHGGVADSEHGGAEWHEMTLLFSGR